MNAGFSSLTALKAQLLNEALRADTGYDAKITAIGLGVAGKFAGFCNREFARVAAGTHVTTGGRASLIVPRYPIEAITALDVRDTITSGWVDSLLTLDTYNPESGTVYFSTPLDYAQIRVTYTGGYFWDTSEDAENPDTQPEGSTALPEAIRSAWFLQCQHIWRADDKLGLSLGQTESDKPAPGLGDLDLIPLVQSMLKDYVRYALT